MYSKIFSASLTVAALAVGAVHAIPKLSIKGSKFFTEDGSQFYIKGVAYQLTTDDPLVNTTQCKLDSALMKDLGANTIRVYHVDPAGDHQGCMDAFANNGIYLFVDLDTFTTQIDPETPSWTALQLDAFTKVLAEFAKYDNTAGVLVGNEVLSRANQSDGAPYIKAAVRDVKAFRDSKNLRKVPVGYSAADIAELRPMLQNYLACGSNASESVDYFSLNAYEWCGHSSYLTSGYKMLQENATDYSVPIFFSETGCNTVPPRDFADQAAIFGSDMADTWSGAIIYEFLMEQNGYGLASYGPKVDPKTASNAPPDGFPRSGTPTPVAPDFNNLKSQWATLTPSGVKASAYTPSHTPPPCPASTAGAWDVNPSAPLPTLGQTQGKQAGSSTITASGSGSGGSPSAIPTGSAGPTGSATPTGSASATATKKGAASGGREMAGMSVGLSAVLLSFIWWL
ncbi:MAG: hypothetical protein M1826_003155 [Phylliscum demangeonii]|nr:MAG: hypothetical protein M1826_003155 [Phylliscum demangeonii]